MIIKLRVYSIHIYVDLVVRRTGKMDFDNQSTILKSTNYIYNFIKQQCQAAGLRQAKRLLFIKS